MFHHRHVLLQEQKKVSAKSSLEKAIKRRDINALLMLGQSL